MTQSAEFWDNIADRYAKKPVSDEAAYQHKLKLTQDYLKPDMTVLEIGCGTGSTAIVQAPFVRHIRATDISEKMLAIARRKALEAGIPNISFQWAALEDLEVPAKPYDMVMCHSLLHLIEDRLAALKQIRDMLKPKGLLVMSVPFIGDSPARFIGLVAPLGRMLGLMPYFAIFTETRFLRDLTEAGFAVDLRWQPGKGKSVFMVAKRLN